MLHLILHFYGYFCERCAVQLQTFHLQMCKQLHWNNVRALILCVVSSGSGKIGEQKNSLLLSIGERPATSWVYNTTSCNTQSSAPEDGQNNFPKHVELTGIINKPLLLHLVGCLYYLYQ